MAEEKTSQTAAQPQAPAPSAGPTGAPKPTSGPASADIPTLSEEFDKAKWTLPPASTLGVGIVLLACVAALVMWLARAKPTGKGSITDVSAVELPDKASVLVAISFKMQNAGDKPFYVHGVSASVQTDKGEFKDDAANQVDFERYFQAYPALREHALPALLPETKIPVGGSGQGTAVVSFPVNKDTFDHRKSLSVIIDAYDQRPAVITK